MDLAHVRHRKAINLDFVSLLPMTTSQERAFIVHSGASLHMMSQSDLTPEEQETIRRSKDPSVVMSANGTTPYDRRSNSICSRPFKAWRCTCVFILLPLFLSFAPHNAFERLPGWGLRVNRDWCWPSQRTGRFHSV